MQTTFEISYYPTVGEILELPVFSTSLHIHFGYFLWKLGDMPEA